MLPGRLFVRALAVCLLFATHAAAQTTYTLSGTVYGGGSALPNTIVEALVDGTATVAAQTTTAASGAYALSLADGTYDLRVTPPAGSGFGQETVQNIVISGGNRTHDVILLSGAAGAVAGTLRGLEGQPIAGANVYAYTTNWQLLASTTTGANGAFSIVASGTIHLLMSRGAISPFAPTGWSYERYNLNVGSGATVNVDLPVVRVSGIVSGEGTGPLSQARVEANGSQLNPALQAWVYSSGSVLTNASGGYDMLLLAGSVNFTARPPAGTSFAPVTQSSVAISADTNKDFTLPANIALSGVLRGRNGEPIAGANVYVYTTSWQLVASTTTNALGQYSVGANGTVHVLMSRGSISPHAPTGWSYERYNFTISSSTSLNVDLPVAAVSGTVTGADVGPLLQARVEANGSQFNATLGAWIYSNASVVTSAAGQYEMLLLTGSVNFTARPPAGTSFAPVTQSAVAISADTVRNFELPANVFLSGRVRGIDGQPIAGANVYVYTTNWQLIASTTTNASGEYSVGANGTVHVLMSRGAMSPHAPSGWSHERYNLTVTGNTTFNVDLPVVRLNGVVTDSNGAPVPNVRMEANGSQFNNALGAWIYSNGNVLSNAQGRYEMLLLTGHTNFTVRPPAQSGFSPTSIPGLVLAGNLTQSIILQRPDLSPPQIVAGPVVVHLSDDSVSVSWTTNEASNSRVEYGIGAMTLAVTDNTMTTNHTVTLLNLTPLSIYTFRVGSTDSSGNGPVYSAPGTFTTQGPPGDITPPVITGGPTVVFVDQTSALIQWTTDEPASSSLSFGQSETLGTTVAGPAGKFTQSHSIRLTGLTPETRYYAQVASVDPDGNAMAGGVFSFSTLAVPDTAAPVITAGPAVTSITDTKITVTWTTNEPATSGVSYNDGTQFFVVSDAALTRSHEITLSGLTPQRRYYITVSSTDAVGNGPTLGGPIEATTAATPDTTAPLISNVQVIDITETSAAVIWTTDERGTSAISYGTASGVLDHTKADVSAVTVHRLSLTGLLDGTTYYVTVSSTDASGNTSTSEEISFKTVSAFVDMPPSAPGPITGPSGPTRAESFDLSWGASTDDVGISSYEVLRNGQVVATVGAEVTTYTETGLAEGGYEYQVRAADTAGHTASSAVFAVLIDRTAPVVGVPADIMADAIGTAATVTFAASATDNVDGAVSASCAPPSGSSFPVGQTTVICSAQDAAGNAGSRSFVVTVRDVTAPTLRLPADQTLEATEPAGAIATFAASADDLVDGAVTTTCSPVSGSVFGIGTSTVQCTATDRAGNTATGTFGVTVVDTTAPEIADVAPSRIELWPPNHQLVPVTIAVKVSDIADTAPACRIVQVTSSEPDNGLGDGDTPNDSIVEGPLRVQLRAERSGKGGGRTYTIAVECRDAAGNRTAAATTVFVPHSRAKK